MTDVFKNRGIIKRLWGALWKSGHTVATMTATWKKGAPQYSETDYETLVKQGYRKNELIFACISKTAGTAAQVELKIMNGKTEIENHPLRVLLANPNPHMDEFDFFRSIIIMQRLAGKAVYEKVRSAAGQTVQLWPLRPDWLHPIAGQTELIARYKYAPPGLEPQFIEAEDVLELKPYDPINNYHSYPPAAVAARVGDIDNAATDYLKKFFEEGGIPPGVLKTAQSLDDAAISNIRRRWGERYAGSWHIPAVLDRDLEYQKTGFDFKEMGLETIDSRNESRICMVLYVPPIMVGANVGLQRSTFSNYHEARLAWWEDDIVPMYKDMGDRLNSSLAMEFGENIKIVWNFSKVPALKEATEKQWERATSALMAGGITRNQFLEEINKEPVPNGDVYLIPFSLTEVPALTEAPPKLLKKKVSDDSDRELLEGDIKDGMIEYFDGLKLRIEEGVKEKMGLNGSS